MSKRPNPTNPFQGMTGGSAKGGRGGGALGDSHPTRREGRVQIPLRHSGQVDTTQRENILRYMVQSSGSTAASSASRSRQSGEGSSHPSSTSTIPWQGQDVSYAPSPILSMPAMDQGAQPGSPYLPLGSQPLFSEDVQCEDSQRLEGSVGSPEIAASPTSSQGEETIITDDDTNIDDDVADPTFSPQPSSSSSANEEMSIPAVRPAVPSASGGSRGKRGRVTATPQMSGQQKRVAQDRQDQAGAPVTQKFRSVVWQFFSLCGDKDHHAICNICQNKVSRGLGKNPGTTAMRQHVERHHPTAWKNREPQLRCNVKVATAVATTVQPASFSQGSCASAGSSRSLSSASFLVVSGQTPPLLRQQSMAEAMTRRQKYANTHPTAQQLNGHLAKLLAVQSLPFQLVDSQAFRELMSCAQPRWSVPSRHYFSSKAVPSLHCYLMEKVGKSLGLSVSNRVHLSADVWSSSHGQGQYMSFTAHWINIFPGEAQQQQQDVQVTPLPPPRILQARRSGSSSASTTSSCEQAIPVSYQQCKAQRCQAVLHLRSLGERSHTGWELLNCIKDEVSKWLRPRELKVGTVVTDNGRNIVSALHQGGLAHVPCMAHVLNLIVHRFLRSYPGLHELLKMARKLCTHFSHSYVARNTLRNIQRQRGLPEHRLICDVATRWNSALHMLDRLYQQRSAVSDFLVSHSGRFSQNCNLQVTHWQMMRDVCRLLVPFEEATLLVSRNEYGVNDVLPLLHIMESALINIIGEGSESSDTVCHVELIPEVEELPVQEEEEEEDVELASQTAPSGFSGLQPPEEIEENWDEEDDPATPWSYTEDNGEEEQSLNIRHMATCLLECLRSDSRVLDIREKDQYWLATLVDPRFRSKMPEFFPPSEREAKVKRYHDLLRIKLFALHGAQRQPASPMTTRMDPVSSRTATASRAVRGVSSSQGSRISLHSLFQNFLKTPEEASGQAQTEVSLQHQLRFQVKSYLESPLPLNIVDPVQFWAERLSMWPQLAEFALTLLSCPASSVASERVFSAAGTVVTPRRTRLSCVSVERLTFIKMNRAWIGPDFTTPVADD